MANHRDMTRSILAALIHRAGGRVVISDYDLVDATPDLSDATFKVWRDERRGVWIVELETAPLDLGTATVIDPGLLEGPR